MLGSDPKTFFTPKSSVPMAKGFFKRELFHDKVCQTVSKRIFDSLESLVDCSELNFMKNPLKQPLA